MENNNDEIIVIKKKKGRPKKIVENVEVKNTEPKKRGRKKKEKPPEPEIKIKKKRGRKAAIRYITNSLRRKIPLTTVIQDNDKSILHLDIKDNEEEIKREITYDVLKDQVSNSNIENINNIENDNDNIINLLNVIDNNSNLESDSESNSESDLENESDILEEFIEQGQDIDLKELYENRLKSRIEQDNNLIKKLESLHNDDNLLHKVIDKININQNLIEINKHRHKKNTQQKDNHKDSYKDSCKDLQKDESNKIRGIYCIFSDLMQNNEWIEKTDINCWWCCHKFNTIPIGLPVEYNLKIKKFRVTGIFCSFACSLAFAEQNYKKKYSRIKSLVILLYKKLTGGIILSKNSYINELENTLKLSLFNENDLENAEYLRSEYIKSLTSLVDEHFITAPPRYVLESFGGNMSIEEFRNVSKERKIFKMIEYPMIISRNYVDEIDLNKVKNVNSNLFYGSNKENNSYGVNYKKEEDNNSTTKKIEEAKIRIKNTTNTENTSGGIDRFLKF